VRYVCPAITTSAPATGLPAATTVHAIVAEGCCSPADNSTNTDTNTDKRHLLHQRRYAARKSASDAAGRVFERIEPQPERHALIGGADARHDPWRLGEDARFRLERSSLTEDAVAGRRRGAVIARRDRLVATPVRAKQRIRDGNHRHDGREKDRNAPPHNDRVYAA
jgi:hypothetical protein